MFLSTAGFGEKGDMDKSVLRHINFKDYHGYWHKLGKKDWLKER